MASLAQYQITYTTNDTPARDGVTAFKAAQLGSAAQDEWSAPNFRLTYGLRVDMPIFSQTRRRTRRLRKNSLGYSTDVLPKTKSPASRRF